MFFNSRQNAEAKWQETEYLLRVLFSRLNLMLVCPDSRLDNNIRTFIRALRDGQSIHELHPLMKDISGRINKLKGSALIGSSTTHNSSEHEEDGTALVRDVFMALLDNINFPTNFDDRIESIRSGLTNNQTGDKHLQLVSAITSLTTILDDIFERVDKDKKKIDNFLKQINSDLQSMDEGIAETDKLNRQKQQLEDAIDIKVTSEVHEMENMLSAKTEVDDVKENVLGSLQMIRSHMETFKQQEHERNRRSIAITSELQQKLNKMENECSFLKQQVQEKQQQVLSDPLTGIRNRLAYEEAIQMECDRFNRYGRPMTLMVLNIDRFHEISNKHGEGTGDKILQVVARTLAGNVRNVDFVARYGGEEFVIILPELAITDARQTGQKMCKAVAAQEIDLGGQTINVSISAGLARMHQGDTAESLYEQAVEALHLARERGVSLFE